MKAFRKILGFFLALVLFSNGVAWGDNPFELLLYLPALVSGKTYQYTFTDLGLLSGTYAVAYAVNDNGRVVGYADINPGGFHAFLWTPADGMTDLGTLGGNSSARGINSSGQIAGVSDNGANDHACLWSLGSIQDLGTLGGPNTTSSAFAINEGGIVAGQSNTDVFSGIAHAALWTGPNQVTDLGTLGGDVSAALAINKSGQVAGWANTSTPRRHAALWTGGAQDLGTLGGNNSEARGVNNRGKVVGWSDTSTGNKLAFLWTPARGMQGLSGSLGDNSQAFAINNSDLVVGLYSLSIGGESGAFLWTPWGGMKDLNTLVQDLPPGEHLSAAYGINDVGQIVGQTSRSRAFLLTPRR